MRVILAATSGPHAGLTFELPAAQPIRLGRIAQADQSFPNDQFMSGLHLALQLSSHNAELQDLDSRNGTFLNDQRVTRALLHDGDRIRFGSTVLDVFLLPPSDPPPPIPHKLTLTDALQLTPGHFYVLLDAAQGPPVRQLIQTAPGACESLYEGESQARLADVAPYLLQLDKNSRALDTLTAPTWWGRNRSLYLSSRQPFAEVRKHLARFVRVTSTEGKPFFFRFYDPRVLPAYLESCTPPARLIFFGPVTRYWLEDATRPLLQALNHSPAWTRPPA